MLACVRKFVGKRDGMGYKLILYFEARNATSIVWFNRLFPDVGIDMSLQLWFYPPKFHTLSIFVVV